MSPTYREYQQVIKLPIKKSTTPVKVQKCVNPLKPKIRRTKTGCLCCRKRKKKCDELRPKCSGCTRNYLECVYPDQVAPQAPTVPSSEKQQHYMPLTPPLSATEEDDDEVEPIRRTEKTKTNGCFVVTSMSAKTRIGQTAYKHIPISSLLN